MSSLTFNSSLITIIDGATTTSGVEGALADLLFEQGFVKDSYKPALLEREKHYPTGLDMQGINVAVPHCDVEHVNKGAICVGVLKTPVAWHRMEDASKTTDVSLVVMLALTDPASHLGMLRKVMALVQDQDLMHKVIGCSTPEEVYALIGDRLAA